MLWKLRCRRAGKYLADVRKQPKDYDVPTVMKTLTKILKLSMPVYVTQKKVSCLIMDLILDYEYQMPAEILRPKGAPPEALKNMEKDFGKYYEAMYKCEDDEQHARVLIVSNLIRLKVSERKMFHEFFDSLADYLKYSINTVKKSEAEIFIQKCLYAAWGIYLESIRKN